MILYWSHINASLIHFQKWFVPTICKGTCCVFYTCPMTGASYFHSALRISMVFYWVLGNWFSEPAFKEIIKPVELDNVIIVLWMLSTHRRQPGSLICWDTSEIELVRCKEEWSSLTMWSVVWIWSPDNICHNNEKSLRSMVWENGVALVLPPFLSLCDDSRKSRNVCLFPYCIISIQLMQYCGKEKKSLVWSGFISPTTVSLGWTPLQ